MTGLAIENEPMRFARIEIRPDRRQVLRDGVPVTLGGRAYDLLLALAARPGHVRSKDELVDAVWPGLVVGENNLVVQIGALRKALGFDCISTVPGRGYQWTCAPPAAHETSAATAHRREAASPPASLPREDTPSLVGRSAEIGWLADAFAQRTGGAVISIVGPSGIGKTTLARAFAAGLAPPEHAAAAGPDIVCEVELAALSPQGPGSAADRDTTAVATAVAMALGAMIGRSDAPRTQLLRHLAHRAATGALPRLLLLDNCEHVQGAVRALVAAMTAAAPALQVLVTSQLPLKLPQEAVLRLDPLLVPAGDDLASADASGAVALFCRRAAAAGRRFVLGAANVAAVADICRRLDGIPLALELAAARVPLLGVEGLHARLHERFQLLRSSLPAEREHHQTLHAALDWSHDLLEPAEQVVLRRLAVFADGFTASTTQQVAGDANLDRWAVLDALGSLLDRSLVSAHAMPGAAAAGSGARDAAAAAFDEPRLRLLETVRAYARERLDASGEAIAVGRRHAEHFLAMAEQHGGGLLGGDKAAARRQRLARELDNLRAAMAWCLDHDPRLGLRLAASLVLLWRELGLLGEGRQVCGALLERTHGDPPGATRMAVQVGLGAMAMEQDDAATMHAMGEQVLQASRATGDRRREAHAQGLLAHAALARNEPAVARQHFDCCLQIYREMDEPRTIAESLNNLAQCWFAEGRCDAALVLLREALPLARAGGHRWTEAAVLQTTGDVQLALGELETAEALLADSLQLRRANGHSQQVVMSLQSLALLHLRQQRLDSAREALREATTACSLHGYGHLDGLSLLGAAVWAAARGRADDAACLLQASRACLDGTPVGSRPNVTRAFDDAWAGVSAAPDRASPPRPPARQTSRADALALAMAVLDGTTPA